MNRITLELQTVTAAFVHTEPEEARWRAAPFRGLARWWFRAVVGAAHSLEDLRKEEEQLFGTSEHASPVIFRLMARSGGPASPTDVNPGRQGSRPAFPPPQALGLTLQLNPAFKGRDSLLERSCAAVWLAVHLGGIGQRSRRGAGSLRLVSTEPSADRLKPATSTEPHTLAGELRSGILSAREILGATALSSMPAVPGFPVLHPRHAEIHVARMPWGEAERAARAGIMALRRHCHRSALTGTRLPEPEFGAIGGHGARLASPIWIRVAHIGPDDCTVVATLMRHAAAERMGADWHYAEDFLTKLQGVRIDLG